MISVFSLLALAGLLDGFSSVFCLYSFFINSSVGYCIGNDMVIICGVSLTVKSLDAYVLVKST